MKCSNYLSNYQRGNLSLFFYLFEFKVCRVLILIYKEYILFHYNFMYVFNRLVKNMIVL